MKFYQEPGNDFVGVVFHTKTVGVIKIYWKKMFNKCSIHKTNVGKNRLEVNVVSLRL